MVFIKNANLSLLHIPKTAGTSINSQLFEMKRYLRPLVTCHLGHSTIKEIYNEKAIDFKQPGSSDLVVTNLNDKFGVKNLKNIQHSKKIAIVRNPITRLASYYFYTKQFTSDIFPEINNMTLEDFLLDKSTTLSMQRAFWKQVDYVFYEDKTVDYIIKYENLNDIKTLFKEFKINIHLDENKLKTTKENSEITSKAVEIIYTRYRDDFEAFDYKIDE
jgi:hypothetical protein